MTRRTTGYIRLHRRLLEHWLVRDPRALSVFITLLMWASRADGKNVLNKQLFKLKRGQLCTSHGELAGQCHVNRKTIKRKLELLKSDGMVDYHGDSHGTIVTILNYDKYQSPPKDHGTTVGTAEGTTVGTTVGTAEGTTVGVHKEKERRREREKERHVATPKRAAYRFDEVDLKAATWFQKTIMEVNPKAVSANKANLQAWANEIRLMREVDKLDIHAIAEVMQWALSPGCFWAPIIQSPDKLRKKWDVLTGQMQRTDTLQKPRNTAWDLPKRGRPDPNTPAVIPRSEVESPKLTIVDSPGY